MCRGNRKSDVTTMVTYSHASTPLGQSERAYYLSYFIIRYNHLRQGDYSGKTNFENGRLALCHVSEEKMVSQQILITVMTRIGVDKSTDHAKPHSICFFYHNVKDNERNLCQHLFTIENTDSDLKVYALNYANELLVPVRLSFQKLFQTRSTCRSNKKKLFGKRVMMRTCWR